MKENAPTKPAAAPAPGKRRILMLGLGAVVGAHLFFFGSILGPFVLSMVLGYLLSPLLAWLTRGVIALTSRLLPERLQLAESVVRTVFALLITALLFGSLMLFLLHLFPFLEEGLLLFSKHLPEHIEGLYDLFVLFSRPLARTSVTPEVLQDTVHQAFYWITSQLRSIVYNATTLEFGLLYSLLSPLLTFYCMRDWPHIARFAHDHATRMFQESPRTFFEPLEHLMQRALTHQVIAGIARSTLHIALFSMMGLPFPFTLGALHGLLLLVPYLGNLLSLFLTLAIMMGKAPSGHVASCVLLIFVLSQLAVWVIWDRRRPLSRTLHPVWILFSLMVSVLFLGPLGVLLSLPLAVFGLALENWIITPTEPIKTKAV